MKSSLRNKSVIITALMLGSLPALAATKVCDARTYGAKADGTTKDTKAIQTAIDDCAKAGGGTVTLSGGKFVSGPIVLKSNITLDLAKVTCDQWAGYKITNPQNIALWLSGYYNGKRGNTVIDTQNLTAEVQKLRDFCITNPQLPVMEAVEKLKSAK